ncbi:MAG: TonB-dependent receptor [Mediterranea sp.]|jgi:TonB-linked SusC/RagA family outer membrane protein|nr:TonB-dependent receptor [Mediterranea sp.]
MVNLSLFVENHKRFLRFLIFIFLLINSTQIVISQENVRIQGKIVDGKSKNSVIGAIVQLKSGGTQQGTVSDINGEFNLRIKSFPATIVVNYIGYKSEEINIYEIPAEPIIVILSEDVNTLEEIIVIGYGTQRRNNVISSIGTLNVDREIINRPAVEIGQALYGKIAGVQVISGSGAPGSSSTVQIRGINSVSAGSTPLVVIDGIPIPNYDLNLINNNDVESIEVLKDAASSAIYGSRAANGVILISTKKGGKGKPRLNVDFFTGIQQVISKIDVMNSAQYAQASIDAAQNGWIESGGNPKALNTIAARKDYKYTWPTAIEHPESLPDTDWQDVIFRSAPITKINFSVSSGNENVSSYFSGGLVKQEGIALSTDYEKYSLNYRNATRINDRIEVGGMATANYDHSTLPYERMFEWAVQYPAIYPVYSSNGYLGSPNNEPGFENYNAILFRPQNGHPLYRINDDIQTKRINSLGDIYAKINIWDKLSFKSAFNFYLNNTENKNYQSVDHNLGPAYYTTGIMTVTRTQIVNYTAQQLLNYEKSSGKHLFSVLLGMEYNKNDLYNTIAERRGYDNDITKSLSAGKTVYEATDVKTKSTLISYFTRINYDYNGRYLLSASLRRDGSSRFAENHKWGYFPAVSAGWLISNEPLFKKVLPEISNLKFRVSYGLTGNDSFDDYKWIGVLSQGHVALGDNMNVSYYPSSITNPDLEWERTRQLNIGLDLGLFNNRVSLQADVYQSTSDGLLLDVPVPIVSGFSSVFRNIGKLENKGLELSLATHNLVGDFTWNTQINFSLNRNKIISLGENDAPMIITPAAFSGMQKINKVGESLYSFYGYKYIGVYKNQAEINADPSHYATAKPGDGRYEDVDKNNVLNSDDRTILGNDSPDFIWGITNSFSYKDFDLSFLFQGVQGGEMLDENIHRSLLYHEGRNYYSEVTNRWRSEEEPGDGYHYKLTVDLDGYEKTPSSYWLRDKTYIRLKNLTLGYTVPSSITNKLHISSLRLYLNGTNLFTYKKSPVYDPENFNGSAGDVTKRGVSMNPYPSAKVFSFGFNIGI